MANYKTSWVQRLIEGAWQKTFAFAHAKTVYTDFANKKTLADKLSEIDTEIGNKANKTEIPNELPANGGNSATVNGHTVKSDVPENAVFTDTVYDDTEVKGEIDEINSNLDELENDLIVNRVNPNITKKDYYIQASGNYTNYDLYDVYYAKVEPNKDYFISNLSVNGDICYAQTDINFNIIDGTNVQQLGNSYTVTTVENAEYIAMSCYKGNIPMVSTKDGTPYNTNFVGDSDSFSENVANINESLEQQGLLNCIRNISQGRYENGSWDSSNNFVHSEGKNVRKGDVVTVKASRLDVGAYVYAFNNNTFVAHVGAYNINEINYTVPDGVNTVYAVFYNSGSLTPENVGNIEMYVNNEIDEVKNDLGGLSFSVSGTTLSITDGTNTWTLSK